jgi:hypothetical protein
VLALLATGPRRFLGYYEGVLDFDFVSLSLVKWTGADALLLLYGAGWVLVPGALLGLGLALARPRSRTELAFGALGGIVTLALLLEAGLYGASGGERIQERYFFYAAPLLILLFALYASRGWPHRLAHGGLAGGLLALSAWVPLAGFAAAQGKANSPILFATAYVEERLGDVGLASLAIAAGAGVLLLVLVATTLRGRGMTQAALGLALTACLALSAASTLGGLRHAGDVRGNILGPEPSFVDRSGLDGVALLQTPGGEGGFAEEHLFWNRSVDDVLLLPGAATPDLFAVERVRFGGDGSLLVDGRPVTRPLLVDAYGATIRFRGAEQVDASPAFRLLRPTGRPRVALYAPGRYADGWLGTEGSVRLWPESAGGRLAGRLSFRLTAPGGAGAVEVELRAPGERRRAVRLGPGAGEDVGFAVCSRGPWTLRFQAPFTGGVGQRFVSVRSSEPVFSPDPAACTR